MNVEKHYEHTRFISSSVERGVRAGERVCERLPAFSRVISLATGMLASVVASPTSLSEFNSSSIPRELRLTRATIKRPSKSTSRCTTLDRK